MQVQYEDGDEDPRIKFLTYELVVDEDNGATLVRVTRSAALNSKDCTPEVPELSVAALPGWAMTGMPTMPAAVAQDCAGAAQSPGMTAHRIDHVQASAEAAELSSTVSQPAGPAQAFARAAKAAGTASLPTGHTQASARAPKASGRAADPAGRMPAPAGAVVSLGTVAQPSTISMAAPAAMETQLGSAKVVADAPSASTAAPTAVTAADGGVVRLLVQSEKSAIAAGLQQGGSAEAVNKKPQQSQMGHHGKIRAVPTQHTHEIAADAGKAGKQKGCGTLAHPHGEASLPDTDLPMSACDEPIRSTKLRSKPKPACRWRPAWPEKPGFAHQPRKAAV